MFTVKTFETQRIRIRVEASNRKTLEDDGLKVRKSPIHARAACQRMLNKRFGRYSIESGLDLNTCGQSKMQQIRIRVDGDG